MENTKTSENVESASQHWLEGAARAMEHARILHARGDKGAALLCVVDALGFLRLAIEAEEA